MTIKYSPIYFLIILVASQMVYSQEFDAKLCCDSTLFDPSKGYLWYQQREDRCEGRYGNLIDNVLLRFKSFTKYRPQIDLKNIDSLCIGWNRTPYMGFMHIQANGLRDRIHYQMDTRRAISSSIYKLDIKILSELPINVNKLGYMGHIELKVGDELKCVYLPLTIGLNDDSSDKEEFELVVLPGTQLDEVYVSLDALSENGEILKNIKDGVALKKGLYAAGTGIIIPIEGMNEKGLYRIRIAANINSGGDDSEELMFYYSGQ